MRLAVALILLAALSACQIVQRGAKLTADDAASAAVIADAAGQSGDAKCWRDYARVFAAVEKELGGGTGGLGSTTQLQRDLKALSGHYECYGITMELVAALAKIPYGGFAIQIVGF